MNHAILKRVAFGKVSVYLALMLLTLVVATVGTGRAAQAATVNIEDTFSCSTVSQIPALECEALVALFDATDGPKLDEQFRVAGD